MTGQRARNLLSHGQAKFAVKMDLMQKLPFLPRRSCKERACACRSRHARVHAIRVSTAAGISPCASVSPSSGMTSRNVSNMLVSEIIRYVQTLSLPSTHSTLSNQSFCSCSVEKASVHTKAKVLEDLAKYVLVMKNQTGSTELSAPWYEGNLHAVQRDRPHENVTGDSGFSAASLSKNRR